jgi:hypothetical protein
MWVGEKINAGRGVDTAGIARKWEGERRCQVSRRLKRLRICVNLTARMYNLFGAETNEGRRKEARSQ